MGSPAVAYTMYVLAMIASGEGDYPLAQARFEKCLDISRKVRNEWLTAWTLHGLSDLLYRREEYERANGVLAEAQGMFAELGDKLGAAHALVSLGREALRTSNYDEADLDYRQALALGRDLGNSGVVGCCLAGFAGVAGAIGELRLSARLFGCAQDLLYAQSTDLERSTMTLNMEEVRAALDAAEPGVWEAEWQAGAATPWEDVVAPALRPFAYRPA